VSTPGVYRRDPGGPPALVHAWEDDDETELADVAALLGIGEATEDGSVLRLGRHELTLLRAAAHAQSFDHPEPFIRMCLAIAGQALPPQVRQVELVTLG